MNITTLGIDLAKTVFQLHGADKAGKPVLQKRLPRSMLLPFVATLPPCIIAMEACGGANYWAREFEKRGHKIRIISPQFVKPYVKTNKNDYNDAEAICEAVTRPTMRFVPRKSIEQQDIQCVHRARQRLVKNRTALGNQIRGLLAEYGLVVSKSSAQLKQRVPEILEDACNDLTTRMRATVADLMEEFHEIEARIVRYDEKIATIFRENDVCRRISMIEGIGPVTATALVASVGDPFVFKNGREMAAWLGLVPRQHSSGSRTLLLGISKRGDSYLRTLMIHGARSVVYRAAKKTDKRSKWIASLQRRAGSNRACVAVANKNARIVWALITKGDDYRKLM